MIGPSLRRQEQTKHPTVKEFSECEFEECQLEDNKIRYSPLFEVLSQFLAECFGKLFMVVLCRTFGRGIHFWAPPYRPGMQAVKLCLIVGYQASLKGTK
jgi:hypothetical protein